MARGSGDNGFDRVQLEQILRAIDNADDELLNLKSAHMSACKLPRQEIRDTMAGAKEAGLNMMALRALVAKHRAERKIEQRLAELEADDLADYERLQVVLGDYGETPLGQHALEQAKPKGEVLDSLGA